MRPGPEPGRGTLRVLAVYARRPLPEHTLTSRERKQLHELPGQARQQQWLASRHALKLLLGLTGDPADTAGYTFPHRRMSLSHTNGVAVAARTLTPQHRVPELTGVGVDIERYRKAPADAARFFLDERERAWLSAVRPDQRPTEQLRLWTVKEALFKADPGNRRTLLLDYATHRAASRSGRARRAGRSTPVFGYAGAQLGGAHLTIALSFAGTFHREPATTHGRNTPVPPVSVDFDDVALRISKTLSIPLEQLTPETTLRELAADSFRLVEMAVDLEEEFDAMFTDVDLREVGTLGELAELVRRSS